MDIENNLESLFPDIAKEWDYELNSPVVPKGVSSRSNKKYYWKCPKGHPSYLSAVDKRTHNGCNCPVCSNHKVITGINDFKTNYPDLMLDWSDKNTVNPETISCGTSKKYFWKCHVCGHEWETALRARTERGCGCPECAKRLSTTKRINTILAKNGCLTDKGLISDWDFDNNNGLTPSNITASSNKVINWKCHVCGYRWSAKLTNRTHGRGCPACSNKVVIQGKNDLETTNPELIKEWDFEKNKGINPNEVTHGSGKKVWWICQNGHSYQATILHRAGDNPTGCPVCNKGRQTSFREQALYFYLKQLYPNAISGFKADFLGKFELDIYIPEINTTIEYDGAAWHKEEKIDRERTKYKLCKENSIKLIRVREQMPSDPWAEIADNLISVQNVEEKLQFVHLIHETLNAVSVFGMYYLNPLDIDIDRDRFKITKVAYNLKTTLESEYPEIAKEWNYSKNNGLMPSNFKPHSGFKAWWICPDCGNEYETVINSRVSGCGCQKCGRKKQTNTLRKNRIAKFGSITNELLLKEWNYEKNGNDVPENYTKSSEAKVWWKCSKCGYEWKARIANRQNGRRCPACSNKVIIQGRNDLQTTHPNLAKEWDYEKNGNLKPTDIIGGYSKKVWWICPDCGNNYQAPPSRRTFQGSGCKKCSDKFNGKRKSKDNIVRKGSFGSNYPELIKELSPNNAIDPYSISSGTKIKLLWLCPICGNEWLTMPRQRIVGRGCPVCGQIKSREGHRKASAAKSALKKQ